MVLTTFRENLIADTLYLVPLLVRVGCDPKEELIR